MARKKAIHYGYGVNANCGKVAEEWQVTDNVMIVTCKSCLASIGVIDKRKGELK